MSRTCLRGVLRTVLSSLSFQEIRRDEGIALKHPKSNTVFLFRPCQEADRRQPAEVTIVAQELDARGLLEPESFEALPKRAPA